MNKIITLVFLLGLGFGSTAQTRQDVLRYDQTAFTGNARTMAVGNAFGALGGNSISSSINPAGIGFYPTSAFSFSLNTQNTEYQTNYLGEINHDRKFQLQIPNMAITLTDQKTNFGKPATEGWISHSFTMNMNRRNSMGHNMLITGTNNQNGMVNFFAEDASTLFSNNGWSALDSSTYGGMGWEGYLINAVFENDTSEEISHFEPAVSDQNDVLYDQSQSITARGSVTDLNFGWGGNYGNWLYVGANLGLPILNYREQSVYREQNIYAQDDTYNNMTLSHTLKDNGIGINASAGVILKPLHFLRIGFAASTPTFYNITRSFDVVLEANTDQGFNYIDPRTAEYEYQLVTPATLTGSIAMVLFNRGFISADLQYQNASHYALRGTDGQGRLPYLEENRMMQNHYGDLLQARLGAEWCIGPWALRGGYSVTNSPVQDEEINEFGLYGQEMYSGGIGYRSDGFFLDVGLQMRNSANYFQPYALWNEQAPGTNNDVTRTTFMVTSGWTF